MNDYSPPTQAKVSKTQSIVALVLGILAFLSGVISIVSVPLGIAAIVFGILGIRKKTGKGMAVGGIVTGSIGLLVGLIIAPLMIFIALPSLQQNQRDTQSKNDVMETLSAITTFSANNQGALPTAEEFASNDFKQRYSLDGIADDITYERGINCAGETGGEQSLYRVSTMLESGENYCVDV